MDLNTQGTHVFLTQIKNIRIDDTSVKSPGFYGQHRYYSFLPGGYWLRRMKKNWHSINTSSTVLNRYSSPSLWKQDYLSAMCCFQLNPLLKLRLNTESYFNFLLCKQILRKLLFDYCIGFLQPMWRLSTKANQNTEWCPTANKIFPERSCLCHYHPYLQTHIT